MRSVVVGLLLLSATGLAQTVAPVPLAQVVATPPSETRITFGKHTYAYLARWTVTDPLSPYAGTTLVWLGVDNDDVRLTVDATPQLADITTTPADKGLVAIISGGMWRGAFDTPWQQRQPDGLVVANGVPAANLKPADTGGVALICGNNVTIMPIWTLPRQTVANKVVLPCNKAQPSALQSNVILVRDGKVDPLRTDSPANRLALCTAPHHIVIAGAFNTFGNALTLQQFAEFIAAAAAQRHVQHLTALNLDGACAAQLYIPQLKSAGSAVAAHYGCDGANYMVNRIIMRSAR